LIPNPIYGKTCGFRVLKFRLVVSTFVALRHSLLLCDIIASQIKASDLCEGFGGSVVHDELAAVWNGLLLDGSW
jgi:hypothetical protein